MLVSEVQQNDSVFVYITVWSPQQIQLTSVAIYSYQKSFFFLKYKYTFNLIYFKISTCIRMTNRPNPHL